MARGTNYDGRLVLDHLGYSPSRVEQRFADSTLRSVEIRLRYELSRSAKDGVSVLLAMAVAHRSAPWLHCHPDLVVLA